MADNKKIDKIFKEINSKLSSKYNGKMVAIDISSGDYFIGSSTMDAYKKAAEKHPKKQFVFKRIGVKVPYFVSAF